MSFVEVLRAAESTVVDVIERKVVAVSVMSPVKFALVAKL